MVTTYTINDLRNKRTPLQEGMYTDLHNGMPLPCCGIPILVDLREKCLDAWEWLKYSRKEREDRRQARALRSDCLTQITRFTGSLEQGVERFNVDLDSLLEVPTEPEVDSSNTDLMVFGEFQMVVFGTQDPIILTNTHVPPTSGQAPALSAGMELDMFYSPHLIAALVNHTRGKYGLLPPMESNRLIVRNYMATSLKKLGMDLIFVDRHVSFAVYLFFHQLHHDILSRSLIQQGLFMQFAGRSG